MGGFLDNVVKPSKSENSHWCIYHQLILRPLSTFFIYPNNILYSRRIQNFVLHLVVMSLEFPSVWVHCRLFLHVHDFATFGDPSPGFVDVPHLGFAWCVLTTGDWSPVMRLWWREDPRSDTHFPGGIRAARLQHQVSLFSLASAKHFQGGVLWGPGSNRFLNKLSSFSFVFMAAWTLGLLFYSVAIVI